MTINKIAVGLCTVGLVAATAVVGTGSAQAVQAPEPGYVPLPTPTRVVDTRTSGNALHNGPLVAKTAYTLNLSKTTVPLGEKAYVLNITAVHPTQAGNLSIVPKCTGVVPSTTTSVINYQGGKDVANDLVLSNSCDVFTVTSTGAASNVIMDLQGYFTSASAFTGVTPVRIADTRSGANAGPIAGGSSKTFTVPNVPEGATSVALNLTAITPTGAGNATVAATTTGDKPSSSNLNYVKGVDKAVFAIVRLSAANQITVYSDGGSANFAIDVYGFVPAASDASTLPTPFRQYDSRNDDTGPLVAGTTRNVGLFPFAPAGATAVIVSVTAVHVTGQKGVGNLKVWDASGTEPTTSNINYLGPNTDVANLAVVPIGDQTIKLATEGSSTDFVIDVVGYVSEASVG